LKFEKPSISILIFDELFEIKGRDFHHYTNSWFELY